MRQLPPHYQATNKHPEKRGVITFRVCPFHFTNTACIGQYVVYPAAFKRCINLCSDLGAVYNACQHIISLSVIILFAFSIPLINLLQIISIPHCRHLPRTWSRSKKEKFARSTTTETAWSWLRQTYQLFWCDPEQRSDEERTLFLHRCPSSGSIWPRISCRTTWFLLM